MLGNIKQILVWIGIFAYLILITGNFQEMVLCHEVDGSVSLEMAVNGICQDALDDAKKLLSSSEPAYQAIDCKKCVDQPIIISGLAPQDNVNLKLTYVAPDTIVPASQPLSVGYLSTITQPLLPQPPPRRPEIHRFLKPIVLLI